MPLCGSSKFCGCSIVSTPAVTGEIDGELPTIDVAGAGFGASPWNLTLNDGWAAGVAARGLVANLTMPAGPVAVSAGATVVIVTAQNVSFVAGRTYRLHYTARAVSAAPAGHSNTFFLIDGVMLGAVQWDEQSGNNGSISLTALYEPPSTAIRTVGVSLTSVTAALSVFTDAPSLCTVENIGPA